jgi:hypothetical protein
MPRKRSAPRLEVFVRIRIREGNFGIAEGPDVDDSDAGAAAVSRDNSSEPMESAR